MTSRAIEPELLQGLGSVVVNWSKVEHCVSDLFVYLSRGQPAAMVVVTANVSQRSIAEWIRTLLDVLDTAYEPGWILGVRDVLSEVDDLRTERNTLVHGLWMTTSAPKSAVIQTARLDRREVFKSEAITASDLTDLVERILEVQRRLVSILKTCGAWK